ncbi:MAG: patatin family protein [Eubacterium sp.]|nr:patatin family protein [Eubacterium sp.]
MIGCIDVGGGLRDIYGAGVFDYLLDNEIYLDCFIGVSAGSANGASYTARQRGRNKQFYMDYSLRKEAMSSYNFIKSGSYLNLEYIYGTLSEDGGEYPLDYETLKNSSTDFIVVATNSETGRARYFNKKDDIYKNDYRIIMASSCLPLACKPIKVYSSYYFDGGISDPLPLQKAFDKGCDKVIVVLTKPIEAEVKQLRNEVAAKILRNKYPKISAAIDDMTQKYVDGLKRALELQEEGKVLIIAPDDILGMKTLTKDADKLNALYEKGYHDAEKIKEFIK